MKIKSISIYNHEGLRRDIIFKTNGLNIITGRSSTGKSALSEIVEYCMGRSSFNVPEGVIRDKVSWFCVIFQFPNDEILIAKPTPKEGNSSNTRAMLRRGNNLTPLEYKELNINSDDETVSNTLTDLLGISENRTDVPLDQSRDSFKANIKHTYYYLFQKQSIVTNKDQLFYRQNEPFQPQAIKDTLPILLGITSDDRYLMESRLRTLRRELKINAKLLKDSQDFIDTSYSKGLSLLSEARSVGILTNTASADNIQAIMEILRSTLNWKPEKIPDLDTDRITEIEKSLRELREQRQNLRRKIQRTIKFVEQAERYSNEAGEQISRLESIQALPKNPNSGEWQWPFAESNLGMDTPIAEALLNELSSLEEEMKMVTGDKPKLDSLLIEEREEIDKLSEVIRTKEIELAAAISANASIKELESRNNAASRVIGRISFFLEGVRPDTEIKELESRNNQLQKRISEIERELGIDESEDRLASVLNNISSLLTDYVRAFDAEFKEFPFRFDLKNLTVVADRPDRPVPMARTGGGENHLAYHIAMHFALHRFASFNKRPIPRFLFVDC